QHEVKVCVFDLFGGNSRGCAYHNRIVTAAVAKIRASADKRLYIHSKRAVVDRLENLAQVGIRGEHDFAHGRTVGASRAFVLRLNFRPRQSEACPLKKACENFPKTLK